MTCIASFYERIICTLQLGKVLAKIATAKERFFCAKSRFAIRLRYFVTLPLGDKLLGIG